MTLSVGALGGEWAEKPLKKRQVGGEWAASGRSDSGRIEVLETICYFYYDFGMDKFTLDFIRAKIDEAVQNNPDTRALNVSIEGKFYTYMISYDSVDREVKGIIMQHGHKRKPINLSDILTK